jgi:hypothetical protein
MTLITATRVVTARITPKVRFSVGTLGRNDTSAAPMSDLFRGGIP